MATPNPITPEGFAKLKEELTRLKNVERPAIIAEIAAARELGDLSENAEYHAAREKQSFIEGRIGEIEDAVARAEVIDTTNITSKKVAFGARVKLMNTETEEETGYRIVGPSEADLKQGTISITSPLARALIGRTPGEEVTVNMPGGTRTYEVLEVSFK